GKTPTHVPSADTCDDCHTSNAWVPAVFDHAGVNPGTCSTCHNGSTATGKGTTHLATNGECDLCHSTVAWLPATFDHSTVTGSCSTCHNGVTATGKNNGHFLTNRDCNYCHTSDFWVPHIFQHMSANYPGEHRRALTCTDCHGGNSELVTWSAPAYAPFCAGCHANDYRPSVDKHRGITLDQDCSNSGCHRVSDEHF
ncbi:MAG: cytochrome c3 family protein, partial [Gammaproteobacteria bacterium]|nr:cytochrome c3 family protein [Gammaproteobacteria bacterium]